MQILCTVWPQCPVPCLHRRGGAGVDEDSPCGWFWMFSWTNQCRVTTLAREKLQSSDFSQISISKFFTRDQQNKQTNKQTNEQKNTKQIKMGVYMDIKAIMAIGRHGGLMVSMLVFGSSSLGSSPCVVILGKTLFSHSASLHPGVWMGTGELNARVDPR